MNEKEELSKEGQGFNDARGEIPDKKDIPKNNGQNVNNDPAHRRANEVDVEDEVPAIVRKKFKK